MHIVLWILQSALAAKSVATAYTHAVVPDPAKMKGAGARRRPLLAVIGACLLIVTAGLVLPGVLRVWAWVTPWVAAALAVLMLAAVGLHAGCRERPNVVADLAMLALAAFVAVGRWLLAPL
jgi:hypothetical protein